MNEQSAAHASLTRRRPLGALANTEYNDMLGMFQFIP